MASSRPFRVIGYIEEFAKTSAENKVWRNNYIREEAFDLSILSLMPSIKNPNEIEHIKNIFKKMDFFLCRFLLKFMDIAKEKKVIDTIISDNIPAKNKIALEIFDQVDSIFDTWFQQNLDQESYKIIAQTMEKYWQEILVFCWQFLSVSKRYNLIDIMLSEFYLLQEIELFRKHLKE